MTGQTGGNPRKRFTTAFRKWAKLDDSLRRTFRDTWASGDEGEQASVLLLLWARTFVEGARVVWESLHSENQYLVQLGLGAALGYVSTGHPLSPDATSRIIEIAEKWPEENLRWFAVHLLARARPPGLRPWLRRLADEDASAKVRREARLALLERGDPSPKAALLEDLRQDPGHLRVADSLLEHGRLLQLTEGEKAELETVISRQMARAHLRDPWDEIRHSAVGSLPGLVASGFSLQDEDVDAVGEFARSASEATFRLTAVDTLAALSTPRARYWLEVLASGVTGELAGRARNALLRDERP